MTYSIKFVREARSELDAAAQIYGAAFAAALSGWLGQLAEAAGAGRLPQGAIDLSSIAKTPDAPRGPLAELGARLWDRLRRNRDTELYAAAHHFVILESFSTTVSVVYRVDRDAERLVVLQFQGLPGQAE